ncbi:dehydrogenase/reductase SDR family member 4 isoform 1-T1 [Lycaon pictus]|uniref:Dehydrogenase/reductase 4 n=1 Tax=Canis lupus familiaris TaxID=9615 RepID=A0A8I3MKH3_CANLF|nr:dehydrogenase/reductase SDR family member 4 isoform X1 [Canis lupus dingo]XP_038528806.1 dehydrogenase/reductase SDR family member 4 isoform X1 [Canis lupus familiaris]|eukprot:XP_005623254.1 dehydrogenase/reductase SDR family member 4 isoform X1 [Canis lupus familiaris]
MQKAGLSLACGARAWRSVRKASSGMARQDPLANKVALVTASTDGIGFAIARRLARDGAHVVVSSRKQHNVDRAVAALQGEGLSVTGTVCHVGKAEDRERLVATAVNLHGGIDILISNAAVNPFFGNLMDVTEEVWDKILDINVKATALMTKAVVPEMEKRGYRQGGSVVIVASIGAYLPFPGLGPYNVSKTALLGLTKNLARELDQRNIRVNCLAPGLIKTSFSKVLWMDKAREESIKKVMQIRRMGKPDDCAGIVSFLCSEDASYITGETVVVGGGTPSHL